MYELARDSARAPVAPLEGDMWNAVGGAESFDTGNEAVVGTVVESVTGGAVVGRGVGEGVGDDGGDDDGGAAVLGTNGLWSMGMSAAEVTSAAATSAPLSASSVAGVMVASCSWPCPAVTVGSAACKPFSDDIESSRGGDGSSGTTSASGDPSTASSSCASAAGVPTVSRDGGSGEGDPEEGSSGFKPSRERERNADVPATGSPSIDGRDSVPAPPPT